MARIVRPHGRRGEVAAEILTDFPDRMCHLSAAELWDGRSDPRHVAILSCWLSQSRGGQAILQIEGSNCITDAKKLVGLQVQIPLTKRAPLPPGSYYISDLIGCEVCEKEGAGVGLVRDVLVTGENIAGTPLLAVDSRQGEILIPLAQEICAHVDTEARRIEVVLPEGLRNLNK